MQIPLLNKLVKINLFSGTRRGEFDRRLLRWPQELLCIRPLIHCGCQMIHRRPPELIHCRTSISPRSPVMPAAACSVLVDALNIDRASLAFQCLEYLFKAYICILYLYIYNLHTHIYAHIFDIRGNAVHGMSHNACCHSVALLWWLGVSVYMDFPLVIQIKQ